MGILPVGSPAAILIWGWAPAAGAVLMVIAGLIYGLRPREVTA